MDNAHLLANLNEIASGNLEEIEKTYKVPKDVIDQARSIPTEQMASSHYPYEKKLSRAKYEAAKQPLMVELVKLQKWIRMSGQKVIFIFEGRDAAGKGGAIKRFTEHLNPRWSHVVALEKPSPPEQRQWYFQRYIKHLPLSGEMVFFDRSWYNRAGVEKVMDFCTPKQYSDFIEQTPRFEKLLADDGFVLIKLWFSVSRVEQLRRFIARTRNPLKQWKLSPMDVTSLSLWDKYTVAKEKMFHYTDKEFAPWTVIRSDDKKRARLNAIRHVLDMFDYENKNLSDIADCDPKLVGSAESIYEPDELVQRDLFTKNPNS